MAGIFYARGGIREGGKNLRYRYKNLNWQLIGGSLIATAYFMLIVYWYMITYRSGKLVVPGSFSWIVIVATLLQFMGVSVLSIETPKRFVEILSKYSLEIYLIHPIVCEIFTQYFGRIMKWFPKAVFIPVYALLVVVVCIGVVASMRHIKGRKFDGAGISECQEETYKKFDNT